MNTGTEVTGGGPVVVDVASVVIGPSVVVTASVVLVDVLAVVVSLDVVADVVGEDVTSSDAPDVDVVDVASLVLSIPAEPLLPP
ncbi:hypothetical protein [Nannocystis punicea]|uniref:Uncharacterized protein n=1 Tax=Nannocystis punicea TaxID=2995304 RepID=A0ABY7H356_9BACT|nr:hypothetical protein [Nannocystis poenicansa]WAS93704.1 hypothetical protein O0S08_46825 [Nannocystis poenicansa]